MSLTLDQIMAAPDRAVETVTVVEWGGDVRLRALSVLDRAWLERSLRSVLEKKGAPGEKPSIDEVELRKLHCEVTYRSVCDDNGAQLFQNLEQVEQRSHAAVELIFNAALRLNGFFAEAVDEAAKNSDATQTGTSLSSSPAISE